MFEATKELTLSRWMAFAAPGERIFGLYLVTAGILAFLSWLYYRRLDFASRPEKSEQSFFAYLLDKDVFLHRSAIQDYFYFFVNGLVYVGVIAQLLISTHFFMMFFYSGLENFFGSAEDGLVAASVWTILLYTVVYTLFLDFAIFITHYAQHKIPILWEFHKVHHSAEVLTPLTLYRMHPVDLFLSGIVAAFLAGFAFAGFYYLTGETPAAYEVMGLNIIIFLFYLFGYNLRHSHIWLNYPGWLSHILISPAQHQIHHSTDVKHFDKNLGLIFAFWDKLFGTLYVPEKYEKISYGINKKKPNPFNSVWEMYIHPFRNAGKIIFGNKKSREGGFVFLLILFFSVSFYLVFYALDRTMLNENKALPSVHIADLTWTEVQRALDKRAYDTIIIPTGGTEQNGPHVILGKHNYVVKHNAAEIARRLTRTLVAPVIAYVPEDVHMGWAGTISVPQPVLEGVLEAAAESYIKHGFKNIFFIGDSHGNQEAQDNVARKLSAKWASEGITIAHIGDYYSANNQMQWLLDQGYSKEEIGGHAGIRDTAEIMFIHPEGLRTDPWFVAGRPTGHNGDPTLASKKIGEKMTALKIEAALNQIIPLIKRKDETGRRPDGAALPSRIYN